MDNQNEKKPTLEEAFTRIEAILTQMEEPEISLEESFSLYQQGVLQLKNCGTILDEVEKKMQILGEDGEIEEAPNSITPNQPVFGSRRRSSS